MNEVRFLHSAMAGAPVLSGTAGALKAVLDACLVNGWGTQTVDTVVVASGVATVTRAAGHVMPVNAIVDIQGATVTGGTINGARRVLTANASQYTFDAAGIPDQAATGTISHKIAPLGFTKAFDSTNLAAYRSPNTGGTQMYLRVDDSAAQSARVIGYESMTDVNTGTAPFPTAALLSGGAYWNKSSAADATAREWAVWGDDRGFYLHVKYTTSTTPISMHASTQYFGDFSSLKSPDPFACLLTGLTSGTDGLSGFTNRDNAYSSMTDTAHGVWTARSFSGIGGAVATRRAAATSIATGTSTFSGATQSNGIRYPNPTDTSLLVVPMSIVEPGVSDFVLRGYLPGLYFSPQSIGNAAFVQRDLVAGLTGLPGRSLFAITNSQGAAFTDITGPWR